MAKKYYAVKKGLTPGIYFTWEDCKKNVDGFPGAVYKGFETIEEAETFAADSFEQESESAAGNKAAAYVDGSYNTATQEYSYGAVIFHNGVELHFSRKFDDPQMAVMRNVAGEIEGSMCAMNYCLEHGIENLDIYFDYEGIEKWCTGAWKANKEGTIAYRDFYRRASEKIRIQFVKVKGHSGNKYNDLADKLAKQAAGVAF